MHNFLLPASAYPLGHTYLYCAVQHFFPQQKKLSSKITLGFAAMAISPMLTGELELLARRVDSLMIKISNQITLNQEEVTFFHGIFLGQNGGFFRPLLPPNHPSHLPPFPLIISKRCEEAGGAEHLFTITTSFFLKELERLLDALHLFSTQSPTPTAFLLRTKRKAFAITRCETYWTMVHVDHMPPCGVSSELLSPLVLKILRASEERSPALPLSISCLTLPLQNPAHQATRQLALDTLRSDARFLAPQNLPEKLERLSLVAKTALLRHCLQMGDITFAESLLRKLPATPIPKASFAFYRTIDSGSLPLLRLLINHPHHFPWDPTAEPDLLFAAVYSGNLEMTELFLEQRIDPNRFTEHEQTPLLFASYKGNAPIVATLLTHRADPNLKGKQHVPPLFFAAQEGHKAVVKLLLKAGADPSHSRSDGDQPLVAAFNHHFFGVAKALLKAGANPDTTPFKGRPLSQWAVENGDERMLALFRHFTQPTQAESDRMQDVL